MGYYSVPVSTDDRRKDSLVPVRQRNVMLTPLAGGSHRGRGMAAVPRPGLVARVTPDAGGQVRGLFHEPGFLGSALFVIAGEALYSIATGGWTATELGAVAGADPALMETLLSSLGIVAGGKVLEWDGATLTVSTDAHTPDPAYTLAQFGARLIVSQRYTDIESWSAVANPMDWPALAFASAEARSDPIEGHAVIGTTLVAFGTTTAQAFYAVGGPDELAIAVDTTFKREVGLLVRDAMNPIDESIVFIARDRAGGRYPCIMAGLQPRRIENPALVDRLCAMDDDQVAALRSFVVGWGDKKIWVVRMPDGGPSLAYDIAANSWAEWTTFDADLLNMGFSVSFGKHTIIASPEDSVVYTLEKTAYTDAGEPIERIVAFHVPVQGPVPIDNITLDIKCHGQPLTDDDGEPFTPKAMVRYYFDGGTLDSVTEWSDMRIVDLPAAGDYGIPAPETRFGLARSPGGFLIEVTITDPIGFAFYGVWVNELPE